MFFVFFLIFPNYCDWLFFIWIFRSSLQGLSERPQVHCHYLHFHWSCEFFFVFDFFFCTYLAIKYWLYEVALCLLFCFLIFILNFCFFNSCLVAEKIGGNDRTKIIFEYHFLFYYLLILLSYGNLVWPKNRVVFDGLA